MSDELDTIVAADNDKYMIRCENLVKIYKTSDVEVVALQGLDLDVERGELMAIVGNSGSGKSTLLNMLGGLDKPSAGNLYVDGKDLLKFTDKDYMEYKRNTVGFVWQNNARNLVPYLTAVQNVELPMLLNGEHKRRQKAHICYRKVQYNGRLINLHYDHERDSSDSKNSTVVTVNGAHKQYLANP